MEDDMATIKQVQTGFVTFIDRDVAAAFEGWQKALVVGGATLLAANFPKLAQTYGRHPMVSALGVYNEVTGTIDIDAVYNAFVPHLGAEKIPVTIPKVGTIKLGKDEIDTIVRYIKEA
jgi:hypothetical protein